MLGMGKVYLMNGRNIQDPMNVCFIGYNDLMLSKLMKTTSILCLKVLAVPGLDPLSCDCHMTDFKGVSKYLH